VIYILADASTRFAPVFPPIDLGIQRSCIELVDCTYLSDFLVVMYMFRYSGRVDLTPVSESRVLV